MTSSYMLTPLLHSYLIVQLIVSSVHIPPHIPVLIVMFSAPPEIVHIVLWRLKPTSDLVSVKAGFQKLLAVPGPLKGHLGETQISERAKGFDYGQFFSVFSSTWDIEGSSFARTRGEISTGSEARCIEGIKEASTNLENAHYVVAGC